MPVRIEIVDQFLVRDYGGWKHGERIAFPNYTPDGRRELLVFSEKKDCTVVYLANSDIDEVDIKERGINETDFVKLQTLREGGDSLIRETASRTGKKTAIVRFSHVKYEALKPKLKSRLN